ncbi:Rad4 beta-hairpin domain 3-domain-containing protein [Kickxella alabastrina]|uniref:Rad4 beta-hairpin domain 3-domain-containing protein n=1 Tax=Kickxella alabastrina TaxID=61397 RepID=UPI0022205F54|nr:Rad4 beta-hairpin domain 3-domain-containing protein [Kickxella alabastrina]KAI7831837.1 Rad4 beta-hairpin domain 3-domain-containing protein [Kickxella alabastrina]
MDTSMHKRYASDAENNNSTDTDDDDDDQFEDVSIPIDDPSSDSMPELGTIELTFSNTATDEPLAAHKRATLSKQARMHRRCHHKAELLCHLAAARWHSYRSASDEWRALQLSLLPMSLVDRVWAHLAIDGRVRREWVERDLAAAMRLLRGRHCRDGAASTADTAGALVAALGALGFDARLCVGITPVPLKMTVREGAAIDAALRGSSAASCTAPVPGRSPPVAEPAVDRPGRAAAPRPAPIHPLASSHCVCDVTQRYAADFHHMALPLRLESLVRPPDTWWAHALQPYADEAAEAPALPLPPPPPMPRRLADFARSRHFTEVLRPRLPIVGYFRGTPVFLRENVRVLRSRMAWHRRGQQTSAVPVPPVVNGQVPRNTFGRLDVFVPGMVPRGAVHVRGEAALRVCRVLQVDAVVAVVGFAFGRGRVASPVIDGVVVVERDAGLVRDAVRDDKRAAEIRKAEAAEAAAVKRWARLVRALRVRADVDAAFARRPADGLTFAPRASENSHDSHDSHDSEGGTSDRGSGNEGDKSAQPDSGGGFLV